MDDQISSLKTDSSSTNLSSSCSMVLGSDDKIDHIPDLKNVHTRIDDVVTFSLCSLCSIKLQDLYSEDYHEPFRRNALERMVKHFNLPDKVRKTMLEFSIDDEFTFLMCIKQNHDGGLFKLIEELILVSIENGSYDARSHQLVIEVAELLGVPRDLVELHCESIYELLYAKTKSHKETKDNNGDKNNEDSGGQGDKTIVDKKSFDEARMRKVKKYMIVGLASLGGAAVMGVTGGLAAPVVASALAGVVGGSLALSTTAAGVVGSLFGVAGAGLTASKMNKRIGDLEEFSFLSLNPAYDQTSLTITIAITGWISEENERGFIKPWRLLRHTKEQYCLCYEPKYLLELSQAMDYLLSLFFSYAAQQALTYTFLASVMAAIAWPAALMSMANIIDNPWDVCINRATKAGKRLAEVLRSRHQGNRPVTLIGFSLGARVIFYCLQELAQHKDTLGIVGDVIILGAPVTASEEQWSCIGRVVGGKIINGYSSSDWLLKFLYRTSNAAIKIAGLQEIPWRHRRLRNINLTSLVGGHLDYYKKINEILNFINIKTADPDFDDDLMLSLSSDNKDSIPAGIPPKARWDPTFVESGFDLVQTQKGLADLKLNQQSTIGEPGTIAPISDKQHRVDKQIIAGRRYSLTGNGVRAKRRGPLRRARSLNLRSNRYQNKTHNSIKCNEPGRQAASCWSLESI